MYGRLLFEKYQYLLHSFANTSLGKDYLSGRGIKLEGRIGALLPNGYIGIKGKNEYQMVISTDNQHIEKKLSRALGYLDAASNWFNSLDEARDTFLWQLGLRSNSFIPRIIKGLYFNQSSFSPNVNNRDGRVFRGTVDEVWATIHDSAGNGTQEDFDAPMIRCSATTNQFDELHRRVCPADTSALTANATILDTSKIRIYVNALVQTLAGQVITLVTTTSPANLTSLAASDYNVAAWNAVSQSVTLALSGLNTSAYNDSILNATGISNINKTGVTRMGWRMVADADNAAPTWSSGANANVDIEVYTGPNPVLYVIDYTLPGGSSKTLLGVGI